MIINILINTFKAYDNIVICVDIKQCEIKGLCFFRHFKRVNCLPYYAETAFI